MKKVGKEFRKSLSAILAAAMVVSSMPETSLVANAEEADAQQQSYELDDSTIVDNGESAKINNPTYVITDEDGDKVDGVTVTSAKIQYDKDSIYVQDIVLSNDCYEVDSVGGDNNTSEPKGFTGYMYARPSTQNPAGKDNEVEVVVRKTKTALELVVEDETGNPVTDSGLSLDKTAATVSSDDKVTYKVIGNLATKYTIKSIDSDANQTELSTDYNKSVTDLTDSVTITVVVAKADQAENTITFVHYGSDYTVETLANMSDTETSDCYKVDEPLDSATFKLTPVADKKIKSVKVSSGTVKDLGDGYYSVKISEGAKAQITVEVQDKIAVMFTSDKVGGTGSNKDNDLFSINPVENILTETSDEATTYEIDDNAKVAKFSILGATTKLGVVTVAGKEVKPDEDGIYTIPANQTGTVAIVANEKEATKTVKFVVSGGTAEIIPGDALTKVSGTEYEVEDGSIVEFQVSTDEYTYYIDSVKVSEQSLTAVNGKYTINAADVTGTTTVTVDLKKYNVVKFDTSKAPLAKVTVTTSADVKKNKDDISYLVKQKDSVESAADKKIVFAIGKADGAADADYADVDFTVKANGTGEAITNYDSTGAVANANTTFVITQENKKHAITLDSSEGTVAATLKVGSTALVAETTELHSGKYLAKTGAKVTVEATVASGKALQVIVKDGTTPVAVDSTNSFIMPASDNVTVTAKEVATDGATLTINKGANVKTVFYSIDDGTTWIAASGNTVKLPKAGASASNKTTVKFKLDTADHYEPADNCRKGTANVALSGGEYTVANVLDTDKLTLTFDAKHKVNVYTIDSSSFSSADSNAYVRISAANVAEYSTDGGANYKECKSELIVGKGGVPSVKLKVDEAEDLQFDVVGYDSSIFEPEVYVGPVNEGKQITAKEGYYAYAVKSEADKSIIVNLAQVAQTNVTITQSDEEYKGADGKYDDSIKGYKVYIHNGKVYTKDDNNIKKLPSEVATGIGVYPDQTFTFDVETETGYTVKSIEWKDNADKPLGKVENTKTAKITNLPKTAMNVVVTTAIDTKVANTIKISAGQAVISNAGNTDKTLYDADNNTLVSLNAAESFTIAPKAGYKVKAVSVNGTAQTGITAEGGTVTVDFTDSKGTALKGQTITLSVETEADDNKEARLIGKPISWNGVSKDDVDFRIVGATEYKDYYVVDEGTNELEVIVGLPIGKKLSTYSLTVGGTVTAAALIPQNKTDASGLVGEVSGSKIYYTFKLSASLLSKITSNSYAERDWLSFTAVEDKATITVTDTNQVLEIYTDEACTKKVVSGTSIVKGQKIYLKLKSGKEYYTVNKVLENGKKEALSIDPELPLAITVMDDLTLEVINEKLDANYRVKVEVNGKEVDAPVNGITSSVAIEGGETVKITATKADGSVANIVDFDVDPVKDMSSKISKSTNVVTVYTDAKDAGKTISFSLTTTKTEGIVEKKEVITPFTISISDRAQAATVEGIEKDATVEIEAGTMKEYKVTYDKATLDSLKDVSSSIAYFKQEEDGSTNYGVIVVDARDTKASDTTTKTSITVDGKSIFDFNVKVTAPKMSIKKATVTSQGTTYANVSLTPETITRSWENNDNFKYEVTVTPAATSSLNTAAPKNLTSKTTLYDVNHSYDVSAETSTTVAGAAKIALNAETDLEKSAWDYEVSVRMVLVGSDDKTILAGGEEVKFNASTKNAYYEDNLTLKKKTTTLYSGQGVAVASIQYSGNASYVDPENVKVNVINANGGYEYWGYLINPDGDVIVWADDDANGKYTVQVVSEAPNTLNASKAEIKVTVKPGANYIDKNTIPTKITKNANKNVSVTLSPTVYSNAYNDKGRIKAASQKLTYELVGDVKNVSIKNNKITISKDFEVSSRADKNKFQVNVYAGSYKNFDGSKCYVDTLTMEVTNEIIELSGIELRDANGKAISLDKPIEYKKVAEGIKVVVLDKNNADVTSAVKITPASGDVYVSSETGMLTIKKGKAPKSITIKAATLDGGKKSVKQKVALGYNTEATLTGKLTGGVNMNQLSADSWQFEGNGGNITLNVMDGNALAPRGQYNYKVTAKGAKVLNASEKTSTFRIQPTAKDFTITITNNAVKPAVKTVINATDLKFANAKAPKFKAVKGQKLLAGVNAWQPLEYTVNTEYTWVKASFVSKSSDKCQFVMLDTLVEINDGKFTFDLWSSSSVLGSAKYNLVFGTKDASGNFVPATKAASLTIKNSKAQTFKPDTNYTISYNDSVEVEFTGTPDAIPATVLSVKSANIGGKANGFASLFTCTGYDNKIAMRDKASIDAYLKANKIDSIANIPAEDLKGYVDYEYWNGKAWTVKTTPVTITLTDKTADYKLVQCEPYVNVFGKVEVKAHVYVNGKPVAIKGAPKASGAWTATIDTPAVICKDHDDATVITFKSSTAKVGDNEVEFKIIPANSLEDKEITVKGVITLADPATYTDKLIVDAEKAVADFNKDAKDTVVQDWNGSEKTGTYAKTVALSDAISYNAEGAAITGMSTDMEGVKVSYDANVETITFTITKSKVAANSTITVPVKVTFQGGAATETIEYKIATPTKYFGLSDVLAAVKAELENTSVYKEGTTAQDKASLDAIVNSVLTENLASGIIYNNVEPDIDVEAKKYNVKVTLQDRTLESDNKDSIDATLLAPNVDPVVTINSLADARNVLKEQATYIVSEGYIEALPEGTPAEVKAKYFEVSASTTSFQIRAFLQQALDKAVNGSEYVLVLPVDEYSKVDAQPYTPGSISFKAYVNKKGDNSAYKKLCAEKTVSTKQLVTVKTETTP